MTANARASASESGRKRRLSALQQGIWLYEAQTPGTSAYNNAGALRLKGQLDLASFSRALEFLHRRHDRLRASFTQDEDGTLSCRITDRPIEHSVIDLTSWEAAERDAQALRRAAEASRLPFDIETGPIWRAVILRLSADEHVLVIVVHHIVSDGWSLGVLMTDLVSAYMQLARWGSVELAPPKGSFDAFVDAEAAREGTPEYRAALDACLLRLKDAPARVALRYDHPPESRPIGASISTVLAIEPSQALEDFARRSRVTLYAALLASYAVILYWRSGQTDILITTPVAGRDDPLLADVVGCCVNTVPVRLDLSGAPTFAELAQRAHTAVVEAVSQSCVPFAHLVRAAARGKATSSRALTNVVFVHNNAPIDIDRIGDLVVERYPLPRADVRCDWMMLCGRTPSGISADFEFASDRFDASTIGEVMDGWKRVVALATRDPSQRLDELVAALPRA